MRKGKWTIFSEDSQPSEKKDKPRFMFAVLTDDNVGQCINLFSNKKMVEEFYKKLSE